MKWHHSSLRPFFQADMTASLSDLAKPKLFQSLNQLFPEITGSLGTDGDFQRVE